MSVDEYIAAINLTNYTLSTLHKYFANHTYADKYLNTDLEFVVMLLKGFMNNFETVTVEQVKKALQYMKLCISADTEVAYTYSRQFYDEYYELLSRVLGHVHYT